MSDLPVRALVLRTAGTNCDGETVRALELAGARAERLHLHALIESPARLDEYAVLILPGGFSYGDYVGAGRILGLELRHHLAGALELFAERGGFLLGICNGFQALVETGLLTSGEPGAERTIALTGNASSRFECRWVEMEAQACACDWLLPGQRWPVPVAHAEGRLMVQGPAVLDALRRRGQVALKYVVPGAPAGGPVPYPHSPSGSVDSIAGLCDPTGRILGLMPHPERNLLPWNHPRWTRLGPREEGEGLRFFRRLVHAAAEARAPAAH